MNVAPDVGTSPEGATADPGTATTDPENWRGRLAGKDRALTATIAERDALAERAATAEARAEAAERALAAVQREALRLDAERKWPLAVELLGSRAPLDDPQYLGSVEARLRGEDDSVPEPLIDRNNPRRSSPAAPKPIDKKSADELEGDLAGFGNPFTPTIGW